MIHRARGVVRSAPVRDGSDGESQSQKQGGPAQHRAFVQKQGGPAQHRAFVQKQGGPAQHRAFATGSLQQVRFRS